MRFVTLIKSHFEAELLVIKAKLESEGITCFLHNQYTTQVLNYMPSFNVELRVEAADYQKAKAIISGLENTSHLYIVE